MIVTKRLIIHGLVQGVGYRYSMIGMARQIGVTGWVRNRRDGTVEAIVQGEVLLIDEITQWAQRGPECAPADLARLARSQTKPTAEDAHARRAARELSWWWRRDAGMLTIRGELPDVDGALVESVLNRMIDGMRPAAGQPWASRASGSARHATARPG